VHVSSTVYARGVESRGSGVKTQELGPVGAIRRSVARVLVVKVSWSTTSIEV
jgi:hypothetical protein